MCGLLKQSDHFLSIPHLHPPFFFNVCSYLLQLWTCSIMNTSFIFICKYICLLYCILEMEVLLCKLRIS